MKVGDKVSFDMDGLIGEGIIVGVSTQGHRRGVILYSIKVTKLKEGKYEATHSDSSGTYTEMEGYWNAYEDRMKPLVWEQEDL